jgi:hypothetical protein
VGQPYRKDVREVLVYAEERGFRIEGLTGSGHWKLRHHSGPMLIVPATPGGYRWRMNSITHINRIHRQAKERP